MGTRAILIGISEYKREQDRLPGSVPGVERLANVLKKKYSFDEIDVLTDHEATLARIGRALRPLAKMKGEDAALIVFSGHAKKMGRNWYFIPKDAGLDCENYRRLLSDHELFAEFLERSRKGHVCMVVDACYGGSLLARGLKAFGGLDEYLGVGELMSSARPSRFVLTAGDAIEQVPDEGGANCSVFMDTLCQFLERSDSPYLEATRLAVEVQKGVLQKMSLGQMKHHPVFGFIGKQTGGVFCFRKKMGPKTTDSVRLEEKTSDDQKEVTPLQRALDLVNRTANPGGRNPLDEIVSHVDILAGLVSMHKYEEELKTLFAAGMHNAIYAFSEARCTIGFECALTVIAEFEAKNRGNVPIEETYAEALLLASNPRVDSPNLPAKAVCLEHLRRLRKMYPRSKAIVRCERVAQMRGHLIERQKGPRKTLSHESTETLGRLMKWAARDQAEFGNGWKGEEIQVLAKLYALSPSQEHVGAAKRYLGTLRLNLEDAWLKAVDPCLFDKEHLVDYDSLHQEVIRTEFLKLLLGNVESVVSKACMYPSKVKELVEMVRAGYRKELEEAVLPREGYLFGRLAFWNVIRKLTNT